MWARISVELSHTWPGEAYLRLETADGTATMVRVDAGDLARISDLKDALGPPRLRAGRTGNRTDRVRLLNHRNHRTPATNQPLVIR